MCLQCYKDRAAVNQNQLESVQQEYSTLHTNFQTLQHNLELATADIEAKDSKLAIKCQDNARLLAAIEELEEKCRLVQVSPDVGIVCRWLRGLTF